MGRSAVYVCDVSVEFEIGDGVVVIREKAHISFNTFFLNKKISFKIFLQVLIRKKKKLDSIIQQQTINKVVNIDSFSFFF